jgi:hypothetical protein
VHFITSNETFLGRLSTGHLQTPVNRSRYGYCLGGLLLRVLRVIGLHLHYDVGSPLPPTIQSISSFSSGVLWMATKCRSPYMSSSKLLKDVEV